MKPPAARALADLCLTEDNYKPDFEMTAKYQAFSGEILRISLLGIGLYGFLLSHGGGVGTVGKIVDATISHRILIAVSLVLFGCAAVCSLAHSHYTSTCLGYQLHIARYLKRLDLDHWNEKEKSDVREYLVVLQQQQSVVLRKGLRFIFLAAVSLGVAAGLVALCFALSLFSL